MADVCANSMAWHPRATYHTAGCCHLVNYCHDFRATCHIAGCSNSIRHIENRFSPHFIFFFCFLMQFGLWRAAAFVSSPIHLFHLRRSQDGWAPRQCPPLVCTESNNLLQGSHTQAHVWTVFGHLPSGQVTYPVTCPPVNRPLVHTQYITIYNDTWPGMGGKWPTVSLSSSSS